MARSVPLHAKVDGRPEGPLTEGGSSGGRGLPADMNHLRETSIGQKIYSCTTSRARFLSMS